jgi:transposase
VTAGDRVLHADERRLGLHGQVRRVWGRRGIKVVQRRQIVYRWRYLLLGVEAQTGALWWRWLDRLRQDHLKPVVAEWRPAAVVWDGSGAHHGKRLAELPTRRVFLPPYSPELNPAERVFEELRRGVEGRVYDNLDAKQAVADACLQTLAADPARVQQLCGWTWIRANLALLPPADSRHALA